MNELIDLRCSSCSRTLEGENTSLIFFCLDCGLGFDLSQDPPGRYPVHWVKPRTVRTLARIYFPFWGIESEFRLFNQVSNQDEHGRRFSLIPAFVIKNFNYFGDIGYFYTQQQIKPEFTDRGAGPIFPGERDLNVALSLVEIYFHSERSKRGDPQAVDFTPRHRQCSLLLVPFYRDHDGYIDSLISWKYPAGALGR